MVKGSQLLVCVILSQVNSFLIGSYTKSSYCYFDDVDLTAQGHIFFFTSTVDDVFTLILLYYTEGIVDRSQTFLSPSICACFSVVFGGCCRSYCFGRESKRILYRKPYA